MHRHPTYSIRQRGWKLEEVPSKARAIALFRFPPPSLWSMAFAALAGLGMTVVGIVTSTRRRLNLNLMVYGLVFLGSAIVVGGRAFWSRKVLEVDLQARTIRYSIRDFAFTSEMKYAFSRIRGVILEDLAHPRATVLRIETLDGMRMELGRGWSGSLLDLANRLAMLLGLTVVHVDPGHPLPPLTSPRPQSEAAGESGKSPGILASPELLGGGRCPVCSSSMVTRIVYCKKCRTPHHEECWDYTGQCSVFGCRETCATNT